MPQESLGSPDELTRIRQFLTSYADGKYRNSAVKVDHESGEFLVFVPESVKPFSNRAQAMLEFNIRHRLNLESRASQQSSRSDSRLSAAVAELIESAFGENFIDISVTTDSANSATAIVFVHDSSESALENAVDNTRKSVAKLLQAYNIALGHYFATQLADRTPSLFEILRTIYISAPLSTQGIMARLTDSGAAIPSPEWLKRQLDDLVRKRQVVWQRNGSYAMTEAGVSMIPAVKGRSSPDIKRVLELARRKW